MVISDKIEDAIVEFRMLHGREPTRLRLGKLQLSALKSFAERYSMGPSPFGNPSLSMSGLFDGPTIMLFDGLPATGSRVLRQLLLKTNLRRQTAYIVQDESLD